MALATLACFSASVAAAPGVLAQWKAYARAQMTPAFSWRQPNVDALAPGVLDGARRTLGQQSADLGLAEWHVAPHLRLSWSSEAGLSSGAGTGAIGAIRANSASAFDTGLTQATWSHAFVSGGDLSLTAIVASQRYASLGLGTAPWHSVGQGSRSNTEGLAEAVDGTGVRLNLEQPFADRVTASLTLQSRIEMDAFKAFRGVNSDPGDFDLPGLVGTGLRFGLSRRADLSFEVQRVFYSEVSTFSSALLPTRFLSLLGDSSSPEFAWRDLTVYGVEASVRDDAHGRWSLRYSTQQQPRPTANALDDALAERYSDRNVAFAYRRDLLKAGTIQFSAAYSPTSYYLGAIPFLQRELDSGRQLEFEARWTLAF